MIPFVIHCQIKKIEKRWVMVDREVREDIKMASVVMIVGVGLLIGVLLNVL